MSTDNERDAMLKEELICERDGALLYAEKYQELLEFRKQVANDEPNNPYAQIRLGEAYVWNGEYDKAIEFVTEILHVHSDFAENWFHYVLLDALFSSSRDENDYEWTEEPPVVLRLNKEILDCCYEYLKRRRDSYSVYHVYDEIGGLYDYKAFNQDELMEALKADGRFVVNEFEDVSLKGRKPKQKKSRKKARNVKP